jgi:septum formation protein
MIEAPPAQVKAKPAMSGFQPPLLLASGSAYRAELLGRLRLPFRQHTTSVDETPLPGEPATLAIRLAEAKARAASPLAPEAWCLGADQAADCEGEILGKPGTRTRAAEQLSRMQGRSVVFHTALSLVRGAAHQTHCDQTRVQVRRLTAAEIERYLDREDVLDCAGSFKCEGLGISLFDRIETGDPTALIGLPLIALARMLRELGYPLP